MTDELTCKEVARLISEGLDAELPASEGARLRLHFAICENCRNVNAQMAFLTGPAARQGTSFSQSQGTGVSVLSRAGSRAGIPPIPSA